MKDNGYDQTVGNKIVEKNELQKPPNAVLFLMRRC